VKKILIIFLIILLFVVGCGANPDEQNNTNQNTGKAVTTDGINADNDKKGPEVKESEIGKLTIFNKNEEVEAIKESGPFVVKVNKVQVAKLEVSDDYKSMFDDKDIVAVVTLEVEVENKSTETNSIYPDQGTIVTDTKEQKEANIFLSDDVGGEYIGEVVKKGNVIFVLDSAAEEITGFKYIISKPIDSNWDALGEDITFDISF
jgi:hypothetical protein